MKNDGKPDAAQGGEQGEVPRSDDDAAWDWITERARQSANRHRTQVRGQQLSRGDNQISHWVWAAIDWYRQNRAPHPSQAGAEAVDEGMVSVQRELVLRARNELQRLMACIESNEEAAYVEGVADDLQSALSRLASK